MSGKLTLIGRPEITREFNELRTITRRYKVQGTAIEQSVLETETFIDYGTADAEFATALLIDQRIAQLSNDQNGLDVQLIRVYQEFTDNQLVGVGKDQLTKLEDDRTQLVQTYVCLADDADGLAPAIGDVVASRAVSNVQVIKNGVGAQVIVTRISAGKLSESNSTKNDGKLLLRTLVYFNEVPATPSGYLLVDTQVRSTEGVPTYTYSFAKGEGEISRDINYNQSDDAGTTGVTVTTITHLTASSVSVDPTSAPAAGHAKVGQRKRDDDGFRVWVVTYAKGTGLVSQAIHARQDGLREVTNVALGTRVAPDGIVIRDDYQIGEGYKVYTVSTIQEADGGANPLTAEVEFERFVPFTYPGRAKAFSETYNGRKMLDVFRSPPVTTDVRATVTVSYQTSNELGTISNYWNPREWAVLRAQWIGLGDEPFNQVTALPGYRSVDDDAVEETCSAVAPNDVSCLGNVVFGNTTARIICTGGPDDPGGETLVLDATLEPAFTATNGTKYYRKTIVEAEIPTQAALPV